jgi:hypothetical protein
VRASRDGSPIAIPWLLALAIEGKAYQVKAGNITDPVVGDQDINDALAEMCVDAATNTTVIPLNVGVHVESHAGATLPEMAAKSVGVISTSGSAFIPLPLRTNGPAATSVARVAATGGVAVPAETVLTTRRHYAAVVTAQGDYQLADVEFGDNAPILVGPSCFYVQVSATGAPGPSYFAQFNFVELDTSDLV